MIDSCAKLVLSEVGFCVSEFGTDSVGLLSKIYVSQVDTQQGKYEMILRSACHLCLCVHECLSGERGSEKRKCCRLCARCGFECICKSTLVRLPWKLCIFHTDMSFGASSTLEDVQLFEKKKKKGTFLELPRLMRALIMWWRLGNVGYSGHCGVKRNAFKDAGPTSVCLDFPEGKRKIICSKGQFINIKLFKCAANSEDRFL